MMRKLILLFALLWSCFSHAQVVGVQPTPMGMYGWSSSTNQFNVVPNSYGLFALQFTPQPFAFYGFNSTLHQWVPCDTVTVSCPINGVGLNVSFSALTGGTNNQAAMIVGANASLTYASTGSINASALDGCTTTGTPAVGNILVAASSSTCGWQPRRWSCQPNFGDGANALAAGTYPQWECLNDTGSPVTLVAIKCIADTGSSTMNVTDSLGNGLLTGAVTCGTSYTSGTQSATVTIASGTFLKFSLVLDGTTKQMALDAAGIY